MNNQKDVSSTPDKEFLMDALIKGAISFDKAILTLASGAFVVSITFIKDIIPNIIPHTKYFLLFSWIAFGISIGVTLSSFLTSQHCCLKKIEKLNCSNENTIVILPEDKWTEILNWTSFIFFIIGIICIITFAGLNFYFK